MLNEAVPPDEAEDNIAREFGRSTVSKSVVRIRKTVMYAEQKGTYIDSNVVAPEFYSNFNYTIPSKTAGPARLTLGIVSPNPEEGKTLVAANLAFSLAIGNQVDTVLVDFNLRKPRVHEVFGVSIEPGIFEAIGDNTVVVSPTLVDHLFVLPAGNYSTNALAALPYSIHEPLGPLEQPTSGFGIEQLTSFANIMYSLSEQFEFIVVDLPSVRESRMPYLIMNHLDGVVVVVSTGRTKQEEIDQLIQHLRETQIVGFVMNRVRG